MNWKKILLRFREISIKNDWKKIPRSDLLLIANDSSRTIKIEDKFYAPILDSFAEIVNSAGISTAHLSSPYTVVTGSKTYFYTYNYNRSEFLYNILQKAFNILHINKDARELLFKKMLLSIKPKLVVGIGAHSSIVQLCKKMGIQYWELAHGIGYTIKDLEWFYGNSLQTELPDAYLCFDNKTNQSLSDFRNGCIRSIPLPHPWIDKIQRMNIDDDLSEIITEKKKQYSKIILLTLQWGYNGEIDYLENIIPNGILHPAIEKAVNSSQGKYLWLLKLHPVQHRNSYMHHREYFRNVELNNDNVLYSTIQDKYLSTLISLVDVHVTMMSMSSYECAWMNIPTLALCPTIGTSGRDPNYFSDLEESGYLSKGQLSEDFILSWIQNNNKKRMPFGNRYTSGMDEVIDEIRNIINTSKD